MKEEGVPFRMVPDSSRERRKVMRTPRTRTPARAREDRAEDQAGVPAKNIPMRRIRVGNRPLQGIRELVRMAMSRSRGESMIRAPETPTALQPRPMSMVRHCLPQARAFWKHLSRLNATRGR